MTICKYYFYIKKNITLLPLYKNSNAKDFFKTLSNAINNAKIFYKDELKQKLVKGLCEFSSSLDEILSGINSDPSSIDRSFLTEENRLYYLGKINKLSISVTNNSNNEIENFDLNSSISKLRKNKNLKRKDFSNLANGVTKDNANELKNIQNNVSNILKKYKNDLNRIIKEIFNELIKRNKHNTSSSSNKSFEQNFEENFKSQDNLGGKLYENILFEIGLFIPIVNVFEHAIAGIVAFFDWFRDHSEEYEIFIKDYEKNIKQKLEIYKYETKSYIKDMEEEYKKKVSDIFYVNGQDYDNLMKDKNVFYEIKKNFENMLKEIIGAN